MSAPAIKARAAKAPAVPKLSPVEVAFNTGRDAAIKMLVEAREIGERKWDSSCMPLRWQRKGRLQNRFVEPFLQALIDQPETIHGFAAVLSACLGSDGEYEPTAIRYSMFEFVGGRPGADGTDNYPDWTSEASLLEEEQLLREEEPGARIDQGQVVTEQQPDDAPDEFQADLDHCEAQLLGLEGLAQLFEGRFEGAMRWQQQGGGIEYFSGGSGDDVQFAFQRFTEQCQVFINMVPSYAPTGDATKKIESHMGQAVLHAAAAKGIAAQVGELFGDGAVYEPMELVSPEALTHSMRVVCACLDEARDELHEARKLHG